MIAAIKQASVKKQAILFLNEDALLFVLYNLWA
jgi:hypothetical protein